VFIGAGAVILGDIDVGDDCVIGANAVVTANVPAGHMALGNPARISPCREGLIDAIFGALEPAFAPSSSAAPTQGGGAWRPGSATSTPEDAPPRQHDDAA
jgi:hypothetical protein